ncbi:hypothetical protein BDV29DRAFT_167671 [Aspergillus leporis]|uniref:Uncharacterized protein n=1 Tax=Aspergillus leporis TaxID=41062 RepID=A0A5N5XAK5_9EURO|nr:hypothetical protein BDV29DRAFT_167671 [Aspergillus leporis]
MQTLAFPKRVARLISIMNIHIFVLFARRSGKRAEVASNQGNFAEVLYLNWRLWVPVPSLATNIYHKNARRASSD